MVCGPPVAQQTISVTRLFEACRKDTMMGLVHPWIRIQAGIDHNPIDKVIDHGGDAVGTPSRS
jgi:hypothetical protein